MSEKPEKPATAKGPAVRTPEQEVKDGAAARKKADDAKGAENQKLIDDGKVVAPAPITGYEHERAKLGTAPEDEATEAAK
ncbi:MAG: hypothetical protein ACRYFX_18905 [Janthinobacterium lividum]